MSDLTGLTAGTDGGDIFSGGSPMFFYADEEEYFYLGRTTGNKILIGCSITTAPDMVRVLPVHGP